MAGSQGVVGGRSLRVLRAISICLRYDAGAPLQNPPRLRVSAYYLPTLSQVKNASLAAASSLSHSSRCDSIVNKRDG